MWRRHENSRTVVVTDVGNVVVVNRKDPHTLKEQLATCRLIENAPEMKRLLDRIDVVKYKLEDKELTLSISEVLDSIEYNEMDEQYLLET